MLPIRFSSLWRKEFRNSIAEMMSTDRRLAPELWEALFAELWRIYRSQDPRRAKTFYGAVVDDIFTPALLEDWAPNLTEVVAKLDGLEMKVRGSPKDSKTPRRRLALDLYARVYQLLRTHRPTRGTKYPAELSDQLRRKLSDRLRGKLSDQLRAEISDQLRAELSYQLREVWKSWLQLGPDPRISLLSAAAAAVQRKFPHADVVTPPKKDDRRIAEPSFPMDVVKVAIEENWPPAVFAEAFVAKALQREPETIHIYVKTASKEEKRALGLRSRLSEDALTFLRSEEEYLRSNPVSRVPIRPSRSR
jgi:hypothetical protein